MFVQGSATVTDNVSFDMVGESTTNGAHTFLSGNVYLDAMQGYRQTLNSYLDDGDSLPEYVSGGNAGTIYIGTGTRIWFTHYSSSFGTLYLDSNVTMMGSLYVTIDGQNALNHDFLRVRASMAWDTGSSINAFITNPPLDSGLQWNIFQVSGSLTGMDNITVNPSSLSLDGAQWNNKWGTLDS